MPTRPGGAHPVIIDSVFYKETDSQHQYGDTYLVHQVLADELLHIGMLFEK